MLDKPIIAQVEIAAIVARVATTLLNDFPREYSFSYLRGYQNAIERFETEIYKAIRAMEEK